MRYCEVCKKVQNMKDFNGTLSDWLPFWSQFQKINSDTSLDDSDKLGYLTMCMASNSPARQIVESYPGTREMYPKVVEALKESLACKVLCARASQTHNTK